VERGGFGEQGGQAVHRAQVVPLADHGQAQPMASASRRWGRDSSTFCQVSLDWSSTRITSARTPARVSWRANSRPSMMPPDPGGEVRHFACAHPAGCGPVDRPAG
jgi:hypothetical protein